MADFAITISYVVISVIPNASSSTSLSILWSFVEFHSIEYNINPPLVMIGTKVDDPWESRDKFYFTTKSHELVYFQQY